MDPLFAPALSAEHCAKLRRSDLPAPSASAHCSAGAAYLQGRLEREQLLVRASHLNDEAARRSEVLERSVVEEEVHDAVKRCSAPLGIAGMKGRVSLACASPGPVGSADQAAIVRVRA